ncbi:21157_t:CDS:1, partial [Racocetra persica]
PTYIIKVETWNTYGDQRVLLFSKVDRGLIDDEFEKKLPLVQNRKIDCAYYPTVKGFVYNVPTVEYERKEVVWNRTVLSRIGNVLLVEEPENPNVYQKALTLIHNMNLRTIVINAESQIKINLEPEEAMQHAAHIQELHRKRIIEQRLLAAPTKNKIVPLEQNSWEKWKIYVQVLFGVEALKMAWNTDSLDLQTAVFNQELSPYFKTYKYTTTQKKENIEVEAQAAANEADEIEEFAYPQPEGDQVAPEVQQENPDPENHDNNNPIILPEQEPPRPQHENYFMDPPRWGEHVWRNIHEIYRNYRVNDLPNGVYRVLRQTNENIQNGVEVLRHHGEGFLEEIMYFNAPRMHDLPFNLTNIWEHELQSAYTSYTDEKRNVERAMRRSQQRNFIGDPVQLPLSRNVYPQDDAIRRDIEHRDIPIGPWGKLSFYLDEIMEAPILPISVGRRGYQNIVRQNKPQFFRALAKRIMLVENEHIPDQVNEAPARTLINYLEQYRNPDDRFDPIQLNRGTISAYWFRIKQDQRRRLLDQAKDQLGISSLNDLFEKIEKLYKDKHSSNAAKGHTIVANTPLHNAICCICVEIAKKRLDPILRRAGIIYTDGVDLGSHTFDRGVSQYYYNNDFSGQDTRQNFIAVRNIGIIYEYLGMDRGIVNEILAKYEIPSRQQGKRVTVHN